VWWFGGYAGIAGREVWRRQEALEAVEGSEGGQWLWRRSEVLEEVEDSGGSRHEALDATASSGCGRKLWMRQWRRVEAGEIGSVEEFRSSGRKGGGHEPSAPPCCTE
jgi:hypothetical protein